MLMCAVACFFVTPLLGFAAHAELPTPATSDAVLSGLQNEVSARMREPGSESRRWFFVLYAYESPTNDPAQSHVFASYIEATGAGARDQRWTSISWIPATFYQDHKLCFYHGPGESCAPVDGTSYSTRETLEFSAADHHRVAVWGPYEVTSELHRLGVERRADLDADRYRYIVVDYGYRERGEAFNCMHAVSDIGGVLESYGGYGDSGLGIWGIPGGERVAAHYRDQWGKLFKDPVDPDRRRLFQMH
jgi:hypothetical protein